MSDAARQQWPGDPDLAEYEGMSLVAIATAVANWPDGSEDQERAIWAFWSKAPRLGHNNPPADETLAEDLAPFIKRRDELLAIARTAVIVDDESAAKVLDLAALLKSAEDEIEEWRKARTKPLRDQVTAINRRCEAITVPLAQARHGETGKGGLRGMLTAWDDKKAAAAAAERRRLLEEQRKREEEAAAARRAAEEAAAAGKSAVNAELEALRKADEAERAARQAEAIRAEPVRSHMGQISRRREVKFEIVDLDKLDQHLRANYRSNVEQFARTLVGSILKGMGVDAAEKAQIPGVIITVEKGAANVRR